MKSFADLVAFFRINGPMPSSIEALHQHFEPSLIDYHMGVNTLILTADGKYQLHPNVTASLHMEILGGVTLDRFTQKIHLRGPLLDEYWLRQLHGNMFKLATEQNLVINCFRKIDTQTIQVEYYPIEWKDHKIKIIGNQGDGLHFHTEAEASALSKQWEKNWVIRTAETFDFDHLRDIEDKIGYQYNLQFQEYLIGRRTAQLAYVATADKKVLLNTKPIFLPGGEVVREMVNKGRKDQCMHAKTQTQCTIFSSQDKILSEIYVHHNLVADVRTLGDVLKNKFLLVGKSFVRLVIGQSKN